MERHCYFEAITPWFGRMGRGVEFGYIMWVKIGGRKRGYTHFEIGDSPEELLKRARAWGFRDVPEVYTGERWGAGAFTFGGGGFPTAEVCREIETA